MSKKLEKKEGKLVRKAEARATIIRRVVRQYNDGIQTTAVSDSARQHEIERAVVKYNEVHKAIKRLRRKMVLKSKRPQTPGIGEAKYSRAK